MSKLNPKGANVRTNIVKVAAKRGQELAVSANGNLQFKKEPLQMLYEVVAQGLFGKNGQLKTSDQLVQMLQSNVRDVVAQGQYDFVANLAIHARTELNIRTLPIVLVVEFANALRNAGASYDNLRTLTRDVIQRADQITDLYAYALSVFGDKKKIPMAIKRGVGDAFNKFNEYAFAKYNRDGSVKLRDVLRIVHPVARSQVQGEIFQKIMQDTLATPYTWETELSANGALPAAERKSNKQIWTELVSSGKVGYMALLRNLRNIHQADLDDDVLREYVLNVISNPERVAKSKQLPFDFLEAYNIVKSLNPKMATAVSKAMDLSTSNIPKLGDRVWLIADYSGSMGSDSLETSAISGAVFLLAALLKANADTNKLAVTLFGSSAKTLKGVDTNNSLMAIRKDLLSHRSGAISGSTNFHAALQQKSSLGFQPDTIVVLTDGEVNGFPYHALVNLAPKDTMKLTVNMSQASSTPMTKEDGWYTLSGWNTTMFKWVPAMRDKSSAVDQLSGPYVGVQKREPSEVTDV